MGGGGCRVRSGQASSGAGPRESRAIQKCGLVTLFLCPRAQLKLLSVKERKTHNISPKALNLIGSAFKNVLFF